MKWMRWMKRQINQDTKWIELDRQMDGQKDKRRDVYERQ